PVRWRRPRYDPRVVDDADRACSRYADVQDLRERQRTMLTNRVCRDERGAVLAVAAVMIPVFLVLTALIVDVGNWYTHKRQLQNRADAGALAAGLELAGRWPGCVTDTASEDAITAVAKRFAGNPADATAVNTEIVSNPSMRFNVVVNGANYNADFTDGPSVA